VLRSQLMFQNCWKNNFGFRKEFLYFSLNLSCAIFEKGLLNHGLYQSVQLILIVT
jgi:hypothetical protein